jgi:hypothetical protein
MGRSVSDIDMTRLSPAWAPAIAGEHVVAVDQVIVEFE